MGKKYWTGRKRSAMAMAHKAVTSEARLIHYELAGRYSIKAAQYLPFVQPSRPRSTGAEGAILNPAAPTLHPSVMMSPRQQEELSARREPDRSMGEGR